MLPLAGRAQTTNYFTGFEDATKAGYASGSVTLSGISWNLTEALIGTAADDKKNGARSARIRTNTVGVLTMLGDITNGAGIVSFLHARYGTDGNSELALDYSTDGGSVWINAGTTAVESTTLTLYSTNINQEGNIRLRIRKTAGGGSQRTNIDDITVLSPGEAPAPTTNVQFITASDSIGEAGGAYTVTVFKTLAEGDVSGTVTLGGTATEGADYSINTTNFTMNGATTSATFVVTITDDEDIESAETITLSIATVVGGTIGSPSLFTLTVTDNDAPPVALFISEVADPSDNFNARFVEIYNAGAEAVNLALDGWTLSRQANGGSWADIALTGSVGAAETYVVAFSASEYASAYPSAPAPSQTSGNINGNGNDGYFLFRFGGNATGELVDAYGVPNQDGTGQPWEYEDTRAVRTATVTQANSTWTASEWTIPASAAVADMTPGVHPDGPSVIQTNVRFAAASDGIGEAGGAYTVTVFKTLAEGDVSGEVVLSGSAANPADYTIDTTNFTMNGAVTSATFVITVVNDEETEADETVILTLANVVGGTISAPSVFTLTIADDDVPPTLPIPTNVITHQRFEDGDPWTIEAGAANISDADGAEDVPPSQRIQEGLNAWQINSANATLQLAQVAMDGYSNRLIRARVSSTSTSGSNGADAGDFVRFYVALDGAAFGGNSSFAVGMTGNNNARWGYWATNVVDVSALTSNSFAAPQSGLNSNNISTVLIRIPDVATSVAFRVAAQNDNAAEIWNIDNIELLGDFSGPPPPPPTNVQFTAASASVDEDHGVYVVTVTKSLAEGDVSGSVTLGGTAATPADYTINTTNFTMNGATTSATFSITIEDDELVEGAETITLTLANVAGGSIASPSVFTLTINDNDVPPPPNFNVWVNELHYDNVAGDEDEGVEIAGPAGTDLSGYSVHYYDGLVTGFGVYFVTNLTGVIPDQSNGYGTLWFGFTELNAVQNGSADGLALVYASTQVIQFLSYEGTFTATSGPAAGLTSTDIGVEEGSSTPLGWSLQLCGDGTNYAAFTWSTNRPHSRGLLNECQTIPGGGSGYSPEQEGYIIVHWGSVGAYTGDEADDDGDGFSNVEEFIAGTIPVPPSGADSYFAGMSITNGASRHVVVQSQTGRLYRLWSSPMLSPTQNWTSVAGPTAGTGGALSLTDGLTTNVGLFRLTVELDD